MGEPVGHGRPAVPGAPRVPGFAVPRGRLVRLLDGPAPIHVLRAPAGSGKTVLLAQWVHSGGGEASRVWVTVEPTRGDRGTVWAAVLERMRVPGPDAAADLRDTLRRALAAPDEGVVLVFDDFDHATVEVADDLIWLSQHVPGLRVVVASRNETSLESMTAMVQVGPTVLTSGHLLLSLDEVRGVLRNAGVDSELAEAVAVSTGRVPLLARAVAVGLARDPASATEAELQERLTRLADGLVQELLASAWSDERLRDFAVRISLPEGVNAALAELMTGLPDSDALLDRVVASGLGEWTGDDDARVYRFTPIVHAALRAELRRRHPDEAVTATRALAEWLLEHDFAYPAFARAIEIADYDQASRVAREHFFYLLREHGAAVLALLRPVSRLTLRRHPLLTLMIALIYNARGTHRIQALEYLALTALATRAQRKTADPADRVILLAAESAALRVSGNITGALKAARGFDAAIDEIAVEQYESLAGVLPVLFTQTGLTHLYGGRSDAALDAFTRGHSVVPTGSRDGLHALALAAGTLALRGEITDARPLVDRLRSADWPAQLRDGYIGAFSHLAEAILAIEDFDFSGARDEVTIMAPHLETIEHWPLFAYVQALSDAGLGQPERSDVIIQRELRTRRRASITGLTSAILIATRSALLLASGNATEAAELLAPAKRTPHIAIARARVALLTGRPEDVVSSLAGIDIDALAPRLVAEARLIQAAGALQIADTASAFTALERAVATMTTSGLRHPLSTIPRRDRLALAEIASPATRELLLDERVPDTFPHELTVITLTERERVVLEHIAKGSSLPRIAEELHVSVNTLKSQLKAVYRKLGVSDRDGVIAVATRHGLLRR